MAAKTGSNSPGELEMTPSTRDVAVCCSNDFETSEVRCALGLTIIVLKATSPTEIEAAFVAMVRAWARRTSRPVRSSSTNAPKSLH